MRVRAFRAVLGFGTFGLCLMTAALGEDKPSFVRAINLNGPALTIDGNPWEAGDAKGLTLPDSAFENQAVRLIPATDENRAKMIRSSRWSPGGKARVLVHDVPNGTYSVYLYVWEDNDPQAFDIRLNSQEVAKAVNSGKAGQWQRLGPWSVDVNDGKIELIAEGGHANLSGLELWRGKLTETDHPLNIPKPKPTVATLDSQAAVVIARHCLECHNASEKAGGLDLTHRQTALKGGDSGIVLSPTKPNESVLIQRIDAGEMPPEDRPKLNESERKLLRDWVEAGAKWAADPIDPFLYTTDRRAGYNWWSLQPLRPVKPPEVKTAGWAVNPIDQFVALELEEAGLAPSPAADKRTLIRRLYFDLIGLPPTPEEVERFVNDPDPNAYENLVDRLLDSPHYGERWARHWLDIVRYGESQGFERNKLHETAWKYRDFVVEAFNSDMPYDQFIRWQIAGDVIAPDDPLAFIASGFLVMGPYDLTAYTTGTADMRAFAREEELEGLVGTVCQTFMGLTVNCARCHDHKFDPITQKEFYQISAALGGTYHSEKLESRSASAAKNIEERLRPLGDAIEAVKKRPKNAEQEHVLAAMQSRLDAVKRLLEGGPAHVSMPKEPGPWHILARGDYRQPGEVVAPRGIASVPGVSPDWQLEENSKEADRRKKLAEWIADDNNPLTARVIVNRLWGYHFGQGLVLTPSDFGFQGGLPSHPELLDWLANEWIHPTSGPAWSLKRMQKLILMSATYRQASLAQPKAMEIDADNRLLWRQTPKRLDAESFRDSVLDVSGQLDRRIGGAGFRDFTISSAGNNETYTVFDAVGPEFSRRSLYRTSVRTGTSPLLDTLDCPDPSVATPKRSVTSTPLQALMLLNNKFMEHYAARFADRLQKESPNDPAAQVRRAYALAFCRQPDTDETTFGQKYIADHGLAEYCLVLLNLNEFQFID